MKTLDEVIKANECCDHGEPDSRCEDCPYNGIGACCAERETDALHYLREYKAHQADWSYAVANSEQFAEARDKHIKALAELKRNDPLSWEELKQMEGKPVWIYEAYSMSKGWYGSWYIIDNFEETYNGDEMMTVQPWAEYEKSQLGFCWQAYRKERE